MSSCDHSIWLHCVLLNMTHLLYHSLDHISSSAVCLQHLYSVFGKSLCTYKKCWKWCPRVSIQAWTRLILFANTFCRSVFGKSLCTYKTCWKWCPRASIQAWTCLIWFAKTFCRYAFGKSLCSYKRYWKSCPGVSIQAWVHSDFPNALYLHSALRGTLCLTLIGTTWPVFKFPCHLSWFPMICTCSVRWTVVIMF
jgi:hypothetical protein